MNLALIRVHGATKLQLIKLVFFEGLTISTLGTIFGLMTSRLILFSTSFIVNQQQMLNSIEYILITDELWLFLNIICRFNCFINSSYYHI